jgi:hypothetical protein
MSNEIAVFGLGKLSVVWAISTQGTNLSAKVKRLTEPRVEKGSTVVKATGFGRNEAGDGSDVNRQ